MFVLVTT